ncbi:glycoside hydrolase family 127 protein [Paenibacillus cookii]|uniref:Glycosyl hydrolase n=1 Tax=Paenibacillus cookii TaxID=157839 RepID=A0ABQ4LXD8_9BACL|nr:beta-L-arabinofuranosidase domain-containing protein [Paenibacillus cookii]GIO67956.1 glycosyl hydrolase [Paenibacillus cookii]
MANTNTLPRNEALLDFSLDQVVLTNDDYVNAFEKEIGYLKRFEADRLLAGFRETAGLAPKAAKYPGWEDTEIRGHTMGHYLTACAQAYACNKDRELRDRLEYIVSEMAECQRRDGYVSAFPDVLFDNVENRKPAWVPWYTMHKIIAGLIAVYEASRLQKAYDVVNKLGDWVADRTSKWTPDLQATVLQVEYGGMNDCLYDLYRLTGNPRHLEAAHSFDEIGLFEAIREGKNVLQGKHANTTIPKFIGALKRYLTLGESEAAYLEAAVKFWDVVVHHHSYVTGGNSESEHFGQPDVLNAKRSDITCETCNSYNMLKLTRELFKLTGDVKYADFYERNHLNSILSSQHPETGMTMYFQPMATGYFKVYGSPFEHFWCCTGTGMENFTKLNDSIYFRRGNHLFVNQYVSSELDWAEQGIRIIQTSGLPKTDRTELRVNTGGKHIHAAMAFRVPYWAAGGLDISVNGETAAAEVKGRYAIIAREWNDHDTIRVRIPMQVAYAGLPDAPHVVAFQYGPVVLSAALGTEDMTESRTGVIVSIPTKRMPVKDYLIPQGMGAKEWLERLDEHLIRQGEELVFALQNTDEDGRLLFTPHYKQHRERYGIYWSILEADSEELRDHLERSRQEQLIKEATVDGVQVGNDQYELQHGIRGERTHAGTWEGLNGRRAEAGGWFSYDMVVLRGQQNALHVTFCKLHHGGSMEIWADGRLLFTEPFEGRPQRAFYEKTFDLPAGLTSDRDTVNIKFVPQGAMNGIYGVLRTLKA